MGLLDKAMRTANDLAGKAETMLNQSGLGTPGAGGAERLYAELGRLVHEEHRGAPADPVRRGELLAQLDLLTEQASTAPPPPGSPPPPGATPPPASAPPGPASAPGPEAPHQAQTPHVPPPPPPPSGS